MSTSVPTVEALLSGVTYLPRVTAKHTYKKNSLVCPILNPNTMGVQSYDGGAYHGHPGMVMTEVEYIMQVRRDIFTCPDAAISDGATTVEVNIMIQKHGELMLKMLAENPS
jgi:hypothetical protein